MKILIDHGRSKNIGDISMLEGVVTRLKFNLPESELFVINSPDFYTNIWNIPNVFKEPKHKIRPLGADLAKKIPFLKKYNDYWRKKVCESFLRINQNFFKNKMPNFFLKKNPDGISLNKFCEKFDGLHCVGGGYLTDIFFWTLFQKILLIHTFIKQGKPVILTGQQIGPFHSITFKEACLKVLQEVKFVGLRDPGSSLTFCRESGIKEGNYNVIGDDSFGLPPAEDFYIIKLLEKYKLQSNNFIACNVRIGKYAKEFKSHLKKISYIINRVSEIFNLPIAFIPIALNESDSDTKVGRELIKLGISNRVLLIDDITNPSLVKGLIGKAFGAFGVSYHFCTFALSSGVPTICLYDGNYYSQKAQGINLFWGDNRFSCSLQHDADYLLNHILMVFNDTSLRRDIILKAEKTRLHWQKTFDEHVKKFI
jgi:polysaccharide pyruvyl transferase WcaK-like protein